MAKLKTVDCELFYLMRIHGKESDKTVTIKNSKHPEGNELLPMFGVDNKAEDFHALIHRAFKPSVTVKVRYAGAKPTKDEVLKAAKGAVRELSATYSVDAQPIDSKWNPDTHRWDYFPAAAATNEVAYAFPITKGEKAVESTMAIDSQTLWVDFVVQVQGQVQP